MVDKSKTTEKLLQEVAELRIRVAELESSLKRADHASEQPLERNAFEDALRQSEARFRSLVEQALVGIYIVRDGAFMYVNPKLAEIFGYTPDELVFAKSITDVIAPESRALVEENIRKRLAGELNSIHYTFKGLRKDGSRNNVEVYGTRTEVDGKPVVIGTLLDNTEKLRLEEVQRKLRERFFQQQKEQAINTLAGGIAHDFNNILMGVLGSAELLKMALVPLSKERELADTIIDSSRRMAYLTRQLLDYAKQGVYEQKVLPLNDVVREAIAVTDTDAATKPDVVMDLSSELWPVFADHDQIRQVLMNLVVNAYEAMEKAGGRLTVRTENIANKDAWECSLNHRHPAGDYVSLCVSDTGPGIPEEIQNTIFEPFFTTKFMGRGLGLAAAAGIVQNHNGCISVKSAPGTGSAFYIFFPRYKEARIPKQPAELIRKTPQGNMVLVVDDDAQILRLMNLMLSQMGFEPVTAESGPEALAVFMDRKDEIRLAIIDIHMPGMGGNQLFQELKLLKPGLKVLISSGYDEQTALQGIGPAAEGYLQKPYWFGTLKEKLDEILGA